MSHPKGDTCYEVSPDKTVRAAFAQGYDTGYAHGKGDAAPQPPALGGELEVIYMLRNTALSTPWRDADKAAFDCAAGLAEYERREMIDRASIAPLQTEIERLKAEARLAGVSAEVTVHQEVGRAVTRELAVRVERDQLAARVAELEGLLREARPAPDEVRICPQLWAKVDAALSVSAEPASTSWRCEPCKVEMASRRPCDLCSAEPSAPVERDERAEFEGDIHFRGMDFTRAPEAPDHYLSPYAGGAWDGWRHGRAALERKP